MYGSTTVRWIVHALTFNRTYKHQLYIFDYSSIATVAINPAAIAATTYVNLIQLDDSVVLHSDSFFIIVVLL